MQNTLLDQTYWDEKWQKAETGWDIGYPSPAIVEYFSTLTPRNISILIPGCGNAHEVAFLSELGYTDISILDISPYASAILEKKYKDHPNVKIFCGDFFDHIGKYNVILEQTFFCAIPVPRRKEFVSKTHSLLKENGHIAGLLFNQIFEKAGPPFGATKNEYVSLFQEKFDIVHLENCTNSIPQRQGKELFIRFRKK